jgi:hypothetical protein
MIVAEVGRVRAVKVGYTAEQLATKLHGDPSASTILNHLVPRLSKSELEKALLKVLPDRYAQAMETQMPAELYPYALKSAYHAALAEADAPLKRRVATWYTDIIRNAPQGTVQDFQEGFFHASNLVSYEPDDRVLVIDHLLARLRHERKDDLLAAAAGIGPYLSKSQASLAVDGVVAEIVHGKDSGLDALTRTWILEVFNTVGPGIQAFMDLRLKQWVDLYKERSEASNANAITGLFAQPDELDDLPF